MEDSGIAALQERLFSRATLLTPNRPEAETFTGVVIRTDDDAIEAGTRLLDMGVQAVLMKGGHVEGKPVFVTDWLLEKGREPVALRQPMWIPRTAMARDAPCLRLSPPSSASACPCA